MCVGVSGPLAECGKGVRYWEGVKELVGGICLPFCYRFMWVCWNVSAGVFVCWLVFPMVSVVGNMSMIN